MNCPPPEKRRPRPNKKPGSLVSFPSIYKIQAANSNKYLSSTNISAGLFPWPSADWVQISSVIWENSRGWKEITMVSVQIWQPCKTHDICSKYPVNLYILRFNKETEIIRSNHVYWSLFLSQLSGCCHLPDGSNAWLRQSQRINWSLYSPGDKRDQRELRG